MAEMHGGRHEAVPDRSGTFSRTVNIAGAAMSMALIAGIGVWGYKLVIRDVSGVPVVRAIEGPMRIQPEDPGGRQALNQGLSVNGVAADGSAARPADRLVLAPEPLELSLDDVPARNAGGAAVQPPEEASPVAEAEEPPTAEDQAVQLAAADTLVQPLKDVQDSQQSLSEAAQEPEADEDEPEPQSVENGLGRSLRPQLRPVALDTAGAATLAVLSPETGSSEEVDPNSIPAGTRLAQLGAFESVEIARQEWDRLADRFGEYLEDKNRVIQKAQSGGRTFYRLRALGFADLSDARRFCSALVAEKAECIPVVTR